MQGYSVEITDTSKELSAKERVKIKDTSNAVDLDKATQSDGGPVNVVIDYDYHVMLQIHNEKSDNKDYKKIVIVDKNGNKFTTGSESLITSLLDIVKEMKECDEDDFQVEVYRKDSKNYQGRQFLTCSLV